MKRVFFVATAVAAALALASCSLVYPNSGPSETLSNPNESSPSPSETLPTPTDSTSPSAEPKQLAKPRVQFYEIIGGDLLIIGEVVNVYEDGGECLFTFYAGDTPLFMERIKAAANVTTTQCFPLSIPLSKLPKGIGKVVVSYESGRYFGESEKFEVSVP